MKNANLDQLRMIIGDPKNAQMAIFPAIDEGRVDLVNEILKVPGFNLNAIDRVF